MATTTLPDAIRQFLEYCEVERGRSPATLLLYAFVLERFGKFADGKGARRVDAITLPLIRQFRLWLHRRPGRKAETLSRSSQNLHLTVLRAFLKFLAKRDISSLAPDKIELAKAEDRDVEFLEADEVERLLAAPIESISRRGGPSHSTDVPIEPRPSGPMPRRMTGREGMKPSPTSTHNLLALRDKAILEVLFSTGVRVGELVRLTREHVNMERGEFAVRGKGGKIRVVFLSPAATEWLQKYLHARRDPAPHLFVRHDRASVPASRDTDHPLTARSIERLVGRYARAAGIVKHVHPHTLRHSYATDLLRNGAQLRDVQALLGHASITTTQVYTHVTDVHLREVHERHHRKAKH